MDKSENDWKGANNTLASNDGETDHVSNISDHASSDAKILGEFSQT